MTHPSPAEVQRVLSLTGCSAGLEAAESICAEIRTYGSVALAAAALAQDEATGALAALLAYRSALEELADPAQRIARLRLQAQDLDARAEPAWTEAAEFAGKASHRARQGEDDLAGAFAQRAAAAERLAAELEAQALTLRLQARALEAAQARREDFLLVLNSLAA